MIFSSILGRASDLDRPAVLGPQACSHGQLLELVEQLAARLAAHGAKAGRVLATALPHSREHIVAILAARRVGAVLIPINPRATRFEKAHILKDSGAEFLLLPGSENAFARESDAPLLDTIGDMSLHRMPHATGAAVEPDDCLIIYTSGSTGRPKGVVLSEAAVSANVRAVAGYLALSESDRCALFTPPSFAYAFSQILPHLLVGGALLPWPLGLTQPELLLRSISEHGITGIQANPTIFEILWPADESPPAPILSVRYVMSGGQPLLSALARRVQSRVPRARIVNMYGCTENSPRVAFEWLPDIIPDRGTAWPVGRPIEGTEIKIVGENGEPVADRDIGEIWIRGTSLMRGYLNASAESASRIENGWFKTRDFGFIDHTGALNLAGRLDNIFSVGHEKISPEEIEEVICAVAGVREAAVVPVPHPRLTHMPVALILADGEISDVAARIRSACANTLSRAKWPRRIFLVDTISRTAYGKLDRVQLKTDALRLVEAEENDAYLVSAEDWDEKSGENPVVPALGSVSLRRAYSWALNASDIQDNDTFVQLGGDSLSYVEISLAIERHLGYLPKRWESMPLARLEQLEQRHSKSDKLDTDIVLRVIAILGVLSHHASNLPLQGGADLLMIIAGLSFARFHRGRLMAGSPGPAIGQYLRNLVLPYYALAVAFFLLKDGGLDFSKVLSIAFVYAHPGPLQHLWFLEVLLDSILIFGMLFLIPAFRRRAQMSPWACGLAIAALGLGARYAAPLLLNDDWLDIHPLPIWFFLFAYGWTLFFTKTRVQKIVMSVVALGATIGVLMLNDISVRFVWLLAGSALLLWTARIPVPRPLRTPITKLASASFYIYIVQRLPLMRLGGAGRDWTKIPEIVIASVLLGIALWWIVRQSNRTLANAQLQARWRRWMMTFKQSLNRRRTFSRPDRG